MERARCRTMSTTLRFQQSGSPLLDRLTYPPWEIRHPKQGRHPSALGNLSSEPREKPDTTLMAIIGNRHSQVYHRPDCPNYTATAPKNRVMFNSEAEAEAAGFHRARNCP